MAPPRTVTLPTQAELSELLQYNKKTGQLFWKKRPRRMFKTVEAQRGWNNRFVGREALTATTHGYRRGLIFRKSVYAHRVIWKMMTGVDAAELDHIDGNRLNNAWKNLRFGVGENQKNCKKRRDNTSGQVGVVKRGERWIAQIGVNGTTRHVGIYNTKEEAIVARKAAEIGYGFDPNHGREKTA